MDLPSHLSFGLAVALVFYGRPEVALLVGLGTLVPDLDREYWYVREKKYAEEQYHRARFHNVFLIVLGYLISPFFSLGIFLHMFQDSFTTAKDRGVEWFYLLTRLVKMGLYDEKMQQQPPHEKHRVYFYQRDPIRYSTLPIRTLENQVTDQFHGVECMVSLRTVTCSIEDSSSVRQ